MNVTMRGHTLSAILEWILISIWTLILIASIVALFITLTGCATQAPKRVDIAVKTDCHPDKIPTPQWETTNMLASDDIYRQVQLLLAERTQRMDYEKLLEAANSACQ